MCESIVEAFISTVQNTYYTNLTAVRTMYGIRCHASLDWRVIALFGIWIYEKANKTVFNGAIVINYVSVWLEYSENVFVFFFLFSSSFRGVFCDKRPSSYDLEFLRINTMLKRWLIGKSKNNCKPKRAQFYDM